MEAEKCSKSGDTNKITTDPLGQPVFCDGLARYLEDPDYPNPPEGMMDDYLFNAIWEAIKKWDISRYPDERIDGHRMYSGATGNDVMHILNAILPKTPK